MKYTLILITIIIIFYIISYGNVKNTSEKILYNIYDLLQILHCVFKNKKINYIMTGGTLLGAIRHKGFIPWDNDADLIVFDVNPKELVLLLNKELNKYNIKTWLHIKGNLVQVYFKEYPNAIVDIFFVNNNNNKYTYKFPYNIQYHKEYFQHFEIFPIKEYIFGPIMLNGPNNGINYLDRTYGDWKKIVKWNSINFFKTQKTNETNYATIIPKNFKRIDC